MKQFSMKFHELSKPEQVIGWYVYRKFNGWAAYWDEGHTRGIKCSEIEMAAPQDKNYISSGLWSIGRDGYPHPIMAPDWWLDDIPTVATVQGELWQDDNLSKIKATCGRSVYDASKEDWWENITFKPYILRPNSGICPEGYPTFRQTIEDFIFDEMVSDYVKPIAHSDDEDNIIESIEDIEAWQARAAKNNWEGLVFINPEAKYELKTTKNILKWKQIYDHEAEIISHNEGTGKYKGKCGSFTLGIAWSDRIEGIFGGSKKFINKIVTFNCNLREDTMREWSYVKDIYPIGTHVDVQFNGVTTKGVPNHPRLMEEKSGTDK